MLLSLEGGIKIKRVFKVVPIITEYNRVLKIVGGKKMNIRNFRKWSWEMFIKYGLYITFEELQKRGEI